VVIKGKALNPEVVSLHMQK